MALTVKDRVRVVTTTTGTSDFVLGGAVAGYQNFSVIGDGNTTYYACSDSVTGDWEVGVGTYSSSGPTLSRDTVLESSNSGSKVSFASGSKDVFVTYPAERAVYLDTAGSAVTTLDVGTLGVSTANITTANITSGTVSTTPSSGTDIANKTYVDTIASSGVTYHTPVKYEAPNALTATYNNGTSGVGATLTNSGTLGAFTPDGVVASVNDRILIYQQASAAHNGVYTVTTVGNGSTAWVLTRSTDTDSYALKDPNGLGEGDAFFVTSGNTGAGETYICNTQGTITFGTTAINFVQVSSAQIYSAGTGLTLSGTQFSITNTGTAGTYGSASSVPVFTTNAQGQVTSVTNTAISITSAAVSGLAASATTDTTNAANITSGTLPSARINGSYTGLTGVGTLTAGTWNATTIGAAYGGTGQSSYTIGDILYADGSTSLAKLADVATGNALISGGVGTAPSWGKIGLTTHVSGTLPVASGGTGATTLTGYVYGNGTGAMTASTSIPNAATTATSANTASAIVARDASGNFSAGTITASLSGNATSATSATSATTATNLAGGVAGAVPYQSGSGATSFSAAGSSGQYLQSNGTSAPTWITPPTIGNGTLTMNVSGTGLSGSQTFTANQSGNATFTVTSNATSGNTASTIVARDASGNFSAGTITATLSGNAGTATTATNQSGGTVNATTGAFSQNITVGNGTAVDPSNVTAFAAGTITEGSTGFSAQGIAFGGSSGQHGAIVYGSNTMYFGTENGSDNTMNTRATLSSTGAFNTTGSITQNGSQVLTAGNYNSYAPTLTGTGASGTWGISITGSAAAATYLNSSNYINQKGSTGTWNADFQNTPAGAATYNGDVGANTSSNPGGTWWIQQNFRHTNSGGYWGIQVAWGWEDNANKLATRNVQNGSFGSWVYYLNSANYNSYAPTLTGTGASGTWGISISGTAAYANNIESTQSSLGYSVSGLNIDYGGQGGPQVRSQGGGAAMMSFHRPGAYAINFGLGSDNQLRTGGWSRGGNYVILDSGNYTSYVSNPIPAGTAMLFVQTAAPTGWTKSTTHDNKALRIVSGAASSGGSVAFTTAFASQGVSGTVGSTTLATSQIPSHNHTIDSRTGANKGSGFYAPIITVTEANTTSSAFNTTSTGGGGSHNHSFSGTAINLAVQYVDVIIATKD